MHKMEFSDSLGAVSFATLADIISAENGGNN